MESYNLPFMKCIILREDVAEIIVNEAVEMSLEMVDEAHKLLISKLKAPFSVLINKLNHYTYTFEAQLKLGAFKELNLQALLVHNKTTQVMTEMIADFPRDIPWTYQIFSDRSEALEWLITEQNKVRN